MLGTGVEGVKVGLQQRARLWDCLTVLNTIWRSLDKEAESILDVGCGWGEPVIFINRHRKFKVIGIDIFRPYLEQARYEGAYESLVLGDVRALPFNNRSFDTVLCMEVLEHLGKKDGRRLLSELERVARSQVLLTTPTGKYEQDPYDGNPHQRHKHVWRARELMEELSRRGYKVKGLGIKGLPREPGRPSLSFLSRLRRVAFIFGSLFSYNFPAIGCHIVAEKTEFPAGGFSAIYPLPVAKTELVTGRTLVAR